MRYTTFGRTGLRVSRLSMGCNRLGDPGADPAQWPPVVQRALDLGVTFFDTSNSYNQGRSEAILGEVTSAWPEPTVIATKGGVPVETNDFPNRDFSAETILAAVEDSRRRLRRDTIDLYMLHSPSVAQLEQQSWADAVETLKAQRKIHSFGISTSNHASGIYAIEHGADFLQIEYDILDPSAEDNLLPRAREHNIGIMVRTPLARGLLSGKFPVGKPLPPEQQWRRPSGDRLQLRLERVEQLRFLERDGQTLAQAALRWLLAQPGVHCVIPGARTVEQLESNVGAIDGDLTREELSRIRELQRSWRAEGRW
ncbi:MAG: aldo/keto reductase [Chloroflexi bacterium]|nr:aldo/keto reductase [Chloroflexota bacterium]